MPLAPPPDAVYPTWTECIQALQSHAAREGYAVNSRGQAKSKETGQYRRYVIRCDRSGKFKSTAHIGIRRMSTKKTDCRFSAACSIRDDGCHVKVLVPEHNHPPSAVPGAHVQHRKMTDEQRRLVETRAVERKSIKLIWEELKVLDPNTYVTFKDVDNYVQKFRKRAKDGATGVQAIMYKLVERQDLFCFTLERDGVLQGAFWVPRWSTDLWMRNKGTPDILVMMSQNIENRPVLPILEMNSVLNMAGFGNAPPLPPPPPGSARPNDHSSANTHPTSFTTPDDHLAGHSNDNSIHTNNNNDNENDNPFTTTTTANSTPAPSSTTAPNVPRGGGAGTGQSNNGLDAALGAGYAILPDKTDATILWLQSAVEKLRKCIPQCPKPRFITLTDFQTAEKNILVEVSRGGVAHSRMHLVFGRVLENTEENQAHAHHGVQTRKPRVETGAGHRSGLGSGGQNDGGSGGSGSGIIEDGEHGGENGYGEEGEGAEDEEEDEEEEEEEEEEDMEGEDNENESDAEIARQLMGHTLAMHHHHHHHQNYNNDPPNNHVGAAHNNQIHAVTNYPPPIPQRNFQHAPPLPPPAHHMLDDLPPPPGPHASHNSI